MTRWTRKLVAECRNRRMLPFALMSPPARLLLIDSRSRGVVQYYGEAGWHPATANFPMREVTAYRIRPSFNPISLPRGGANMKTETGATK
ncbi:MAG TPA: hypothetical protein PLE60_14805 [Candidatus Latescibacteria bacterium]|nr:hypothetical protein [Candidatus Latescibacterota bacterium]